MASIGLTLQVTLDNGSNFEKFAHAIAILTEAAEDLPWRDDLREASELLEEITFTMTAPRQE